jgi:hypothetical protein
VCVFAIEFVVEVSDVEGDENVIVDSVVELDICLVVELLVTVIDTD